MDFYALDVDTFASLVASIGGCSEDAVSSSLLSGKRPAFSVARAIEVVTGVDAHDWFIEEWGTRAVLRAPRPDSETKPAAFEQPKLSEVA